MGHALHPDLRAFLDEHGLDAERLALATSLGSAPAGPSGPRERVMLSAGEGLAEWHVPSLRALFRGARTPPPMTDYPPEYVPVFYEIERLLLAWSLAVRVPTDAEVEEAFSNLRRRPDGRSFGAVHDALWQISAFTLGTFALSGPEFEAVVGRLAKSARGWSRGTVSRGYLQYLSENFG